MERTSLKRTKKSKKVWLYRGEVVLRYFHCLIASVAKESPSQLSSRHAVGNLTSTGIYLPDGDCPLNSYSEYCYWACTRPS